VAVARSPHTVDIEFLPKGLHDVGSGAMRERLQAALDRVDAAKYNVTLLAYGLCNNGLAGLVARAIPLVVPRAHDCITMFFGSRQRYQEYFNTHPGVYFKTTGWIERGEAAGELKQLSIPHQVGIDLTYDELVAKHGEDNARYLYAELGNYVKHYNQLTFIEMGVEPDGSFEQRTRDEAAQRGWKFEKVSGDMSMLQRLVDGIWDENEFLLVAPGWRIVAKYDEGIIAAEKVAS
jgi:hypothetical protein